MVIRYALTDERGQVGIGTLIVFIALVLVAAIAAGVLINTAGFLQTQAEQTGEDSSSQVANNINVIGEVGVVNSSSSPLGINETRLTVQRSPGSDNVDLSELSIQYVGDNGFANLIHISTAETDVDTGTTDVTDEYVYTLDTITSASTDAVMTDDSDRYQIVLPFKGADLGDGSSGELIENDPLTSEVDSGITTDGTATGIDAVANSDIQDLAPGQEGDIQITTADRATRNAFVQVPDTIESDETSVTL